MIKISNKLNKKTKIFIIIITMVYLFPLSFDFVTAAKIKCKTPTTTPIYLESPFPGMNVTKKGVGSVEDFTEYVLLLYKYLIYLSGIVAVIMIMIAGFQWVSAGGNSSKIGEAKSRITSALIGLFLVFGVYIILYTINPVLVNPVMPKICDINSVPLESKTKETCADDRGRICTNCSENNPSNCYCDSAGVEDFYLISDGWAGQPAYCCVCKQCSKDRQFSATGNCQKICADLGCTGPVMGEEYFSYGTCCDCSDCPGPDLTDSECDTEPMYSSCTLDRGDGLYADAGDPGYCGSDKRCIKCIDLGQECVDSLQCVNYDHNYEALDVDGCGFEYTDATVSCHDGFLGLGANKCDDIDL